MVLESFSDVSKKPLKMEKLILVRQPNFSKKVHSCIEEKMRQNSSFFELYKN